MKILHTSSHRSAAAITHDASRITHHASRRSLITSHQTPVAQPSTLNPQLSTPQTGIALVIVMISIFVLSMLAGGFAYSMKIETKLARNANSEAELEWLGRSGVEYARWVLANSMNPMEPYDSLDQAWATGSGWLGPTNAPIAEVQQDVHLGNGTFNWKIIDLERKFNINCPEPVLQQVLPQALTLIGVDTGEATPIVSSILDWIDVNERALVTRVEGAKTEYYQNLTPPYRAKNGPIDDITELLLIKGITPEIYYGIAATNYQPSYFDHQRNRFDQPAAMPSVTVGLKDLCTPLSVGKININTASAEVLQMVPGVTSMIAEAIVSGRAGLDASAPDVMGPYRQVTDVSRMPNIPPGMGSQLSQFCDVHSRTFQVEVVANVGGYSRTFCAVLGRNPQNPRDVQILTFYWK
jgi:general secretion pathway protein K